nr:N-U1 [Pinctada fucata]
MVLLRRVLHAIRIPLLSLRNVIHSEVRNSSYGNSNDFALPSRLCDWITDKYFFNIDNDKMHIIGYTCLV